MAQWLAFKFHNVRVVNGLSKNRCVINIESYFFGICSQIAFIKLPWDLNFGG